MTKSRREYFKRNKRNIRREQKFTLEGILAGSFGAAALILFLVSVIRSLRRAGEAGALLGTAGLLGLIFALAALLLGILAFKQKNVRPFPPKAGVICGGIFTAVFGALYVYGFMI